MNFTHDCDRCISLGEYEDKEGRHDLYICHDNNHGFHSLIARFGNEGPQYRSFSVDSNTLELFRREPGYVLSVAYERAVKAGHRFKKAERGEIRKKILDARLAKIRNNTEQYQKLCQEIKALRKLT